MLELYDVTSLVIDTLNSAETTRLDLKPYNNYGNMSWGAQTQTTFIQGSHQKTSEKDDSNSALFYLFQEVSMLAPPSHCSFSETKSTPKLLGGTTVQDKTEEDGDVFKTLNGSRLQCLSGSHGVNTFKEECGCHDSSCELNSPWKVLNLINLQCERLLHHRDEDKSTPRSVLPAVTLCQSVTAEASTEVDVTELEAETATVQNTETHFDYKTEELPASVEHGNNGRVDLHSVGGQCCVNESGSCGVTGLSEEVKENAFSHPHHSVQECTHPFPNPAFFQHVPSSQQSTDVNSFPSECVSLSKSVLTLDCNANVVTTDPIVDTQQSPFHAVLPSVLSVSCVIKRHNPLPQTGIVGSQPESTHSSVKDKSPHDPLFKPTVSKISSAKFPPEDSPAQKKEIEPQTILKWRTRSRRKQPYPSRSIDIQDPNVQGVTFSMGSELDDSREHCRLLITWKYSKELCKRERKLQPRTRKSYKTSSSDEENDHLTTVPKSKACASCCTRKTPMWRDAEDGTPLCNACGIRYKKYRVRCVSCWHIPRKESNSNSCCLKCGNLVIQISGQRKHTS